MSVRVSERAQAGGRAAAALGAARGARGRGAGALAASCLLRPAVAGQLVVVVLMLHII